MLGPSSSVGQESGEGLVQMSLFDGDTACGASFDLAELFEAYYRCRAKKRNTLNAIAFEVDLETNLVQLWHELNTRSYSPGRSVAFVIDKPVKREIFAADFRDRVVHHLIINKLTPSFEAEFIHDSYASRPGRGTLFGVRRLQRFIRACSSNYSCDAYVLRLDISAFFMNINVEILFTKLKSFIEAKYHEPDRDLLIDLCRVVVLNDVTKCAAIKGDRSDWDGLPAAKSLFGTPAGCGLPIGNLTSQVFANFYLNELDHFIKHQLGVRYYGRYVDDLVLVDRDRSRLAALIPVLTSYLRAELGLQLHPRKTELQHYSKGVRFLGAVIKPGRVYVGKRTKGNFHNSIITHNAAAVGRVPSRAEQQAFLASMNSYLGLLRHYDTRRLRYSILAKYVKGWWSYAEVTPGAEKFVLRSGVREPLRRARRQS